MHLKNSLLATIAAISFLSFQSCKKDSGPVPDPTPVVKPDTLGVGWTKKVIPGETSFSDIFFNSSTTGYLAGSNLYRSTNGGNTWDSVSPAQFTNIFITNDNKGFFVGQTTGIVKTINGGNTFVTTSIADSPSDIFFIDNNTGFCIASNGVYTTVDAGIVWTKIIPTGSPLPNNSSYRTIAAFNSTTGWVADNSGIYKTAGSFANWQHATVTGGTNNTFFASLFAISASTVYAANERAEIFKSTDGGANFSFLNKLTDGYFTDIHFLDNLNGYASTGRHVLKTTDGGLNWTKVVSLGQGTLGELHFTDVNHGWVCSYGNDGVVLTFKQ